MKILIGTTNPGKIKGAKLAFENYFDNIEIAGVKINSGVPDEPTNLDIYKGAKTRVDNLIEYAKKNNLSADYFVGIESGITNLLGKWIIINIAVIKNIYGKESWGTSQGFPVPNKYVDEIISKDLGKVMDSLFNETDLRSSKGGINLLTKEKVNRINLTEQAFIMALTQVINKDIWSD